MVVGCVLASLMPVMIDPSSGSDVAAGLKGASGSVLGRIFSLPIVSSAENF